MTISKSAKIISSRRQNGARINGVSMETIEGAAKSGYARACIGFETGAAPLTGEPSRKGASRVYVKLTGNRGDLAFLPVRNETGITGFEIAASGDDACIALTAALMEIAENLRRNL